MKNTTYTTMSRNIGQVRERDADTKIAQLNSETKKLWRRDYSEFLYERDADGDSHNPSRLSEGFVWIIRD